MLEGDLVEDFILLEGGLVEDFVGLITRTPKPRLCRVNGDKKKEYPCTSPTHNELKKCHEAPDMVLVMDNTFIGALISSIPERFQKKVHAKLSDNMDIMDKADVIRAFATKLIKNNSEGLMFKDEAALARFFDHCVNRYSEEKIRLSQLLMGDHINVLVNHKNTWYCQSCIAYYNRITRYETQWLLYTLYTLVQKYPHRANPSFWTMFPFEIIYRIGEACVLPVVRFACPHSPCTDYHVNPDTCEHNNGTKRMWNWTRNNTPNTINANPYITGNRIPPNRPHWEWIEMPENDNNA